VHLVSDILSQQKSQQGVAFGSGARGGSFFVIGQHHRDEVGGYGRDRMYQERSERGVGYHAFKDRPTGSQAIELCAMAVKTKTPPAFSADGVQVAPEAGSEYALITLRQNCRHGKV
jgi:hypothetical protein